MINIIDYNNLFDESLHFLKQQVKNKMKEENKNGKWIPQGGICIEDRKYKKIYIQTMVLVKENNVF